MSNTNLVVAEIFDNVPGANIALGMLRANGIPCILDHELVYSVLNINLTPDNGIRLMVYERDLPTALRLLEQAKD